MKAMKTMYSVHRSTSALNTTVATKRGVVAVGGKARNTGERDLVTQTRQ